MNRILCLKTLNWLWSRNRILLELSRNPANASCNFLKINRELHQKVYQKFVSSSFIRNSSVHHLCWWSRDWCHRRLRLRRHQDTCCLLGTVPSAQARSGRWRWIEWAGKEPYLELQLNDLAESTNIDSSSHQVHSLSEITFVELVSSWLAVNVRRLCWQLEYISACNQIRRCSNLKMTTRR